MSTVTLGVSSREQTNRRFLEAFEGKPQGELISFETTALLFRVLTQKRWELLSVLTGAGPVTLREAARRIGRDVKAVHGDVHALLDSGILQKTDDGRVVFPFDAVHVNFHAAGCLRLLQLQRAVTALWKRDLRIWRALTAPRTWVTALCPETCRSQGAVTAL